MVRAPAMQAGDRGFKSRSGQFSPSLKLLTVLSDSICLALLELLHCTCTCVCVYILVLVSPRAEPLPHISVHTCTSTCVCVVC